MKKIYLLFSLLLSTFTQAQEWSNWITVYNEGAGGLRGSISISFKQNTKDNVCNGGQYSWYKIQSTYLDTVWGKVHFTIIGCDGKPIVEDIPIDFEGPGINQGYGNWLQGACIGTPITDIRIDCVLGNLSNSPCFKSNERKAAAQTLATSNLHAYDSLISSGDSYYNSKNYDAASQNYSEGKPMNTGTFMWHLTATLLDGTSIDKTGNVALVR